MGDVKWVCRDPWFGQMWLPCSSETGGRAKTLHRWCGWV